VSQQLTQLPLALATRRAAREVRLDRQGLGPGQGAVHPVVQTFVELVAGHETRASLSSRRARKSWAFDVPGAIDSIAAISS